MNTTETHTSRQKIIDTAEKLFAEKGFHSVSLNQIAQAAGISKSLILYHFTDKDSLYKSVIERVVSYLQENLLKILSTSLQPDKKIAFFIEEYFNLLESREASLHILVREMSNLETPITKYLFSNLRNLVNAISSVIEKGIKQKIFKEVDPEQTAISLLGIMNAHIAARIIGSGNKQIVAPEQHNIQQTSEICKTIFFKGIEDAE